MPTSLGRAILSLLGATTLGAGVASAQEQFRLETLIAAAQKEAPITVYDNTGRILEQAKAFSAKFGVKATGVKVTAATMLEMAIREARAKNVQGDVLVISDVPAAQAQLAPEKYAVSWLPPDLGPGVPESFRDPLVVATDPTVWAYNKKVHASCPVSNIWELTETKWKGKVAISDPLVKTSYPDLFNQMARHGDAAVASAYKARYGKDLATSEKSATHAWVKALAQNSPLVADDHERIADAIGAPNQTAPFIGLVSTAKFRSNAEGYELGLCSDFGPWVGFGTPKAAVVATGSKSPNAARLFVHYLLTAEGIGPQVADGKMPSNPQIKLPADEPSGVGSVLAKMFQFKSATALDDWDTRQDWQDFWRLNLKK